MRIHHSNRLEVLAADLAALMLAEPGDPFAPERIVVPHPTIARWLTLELARAMGIAANLHFELPAAFAWSVMRGAIPELSDEQAYAPERLRWCIHDLLPQFAQGPAGETVRGYLADGDPRKRFELADRLARVYDRCLLYRPDWIREWERGATPHWQARLWCRLIGEDRSGESPTDKASLSEDRPGKDRLGEDSSGRDAGGRDAGGREALGEAPPWQDPPRDHWVRSVDAFRDALPKGERPSAWPRRASFFAVPALSPSYLEVMCRAGEGIDLHVFLLNPCREYWGDIYSRHESRRKARGADPDERYLTEGNELLAAWGRAGRDTFDALVEIAGDETDERFAPSEGGRRLAMVQRDILDLHLAQEASLRETVTGSGAPPDDSADGSASDSPDGLPGDSLGDAPNNSLDGSPGDAPGDSTDDSLQIHICHSPMREAEVLHDRLLGLFDAHSDLEPADVLVLAPELDVYGPAIEAVFDAEGRIPVQRSRLRASESPSVRALLDLLALPRSRYGAEAVLAPLEAFAVRARFGIGEADLPAIRQWVRDAGIRWGVDAAHRGEEGLPKMADHTWRQGLRRLLIGYAAANADDLVADTVPCMMRGAGGFDPGEADYERLGRFLTYCDAVFELRTRLAADRDVAGWAKALHETITGFFGNGVAPASVPASARDSAKPSGSREIADDVDAVRRLVGDFEREAAGARAPVSFEVVRHALAQQADVVSPEPARLADGVTIARLAPGRIFPATVVCVVGMNDGVFPRSFTPPTFDLAATGPPRRGDRDVRHEDRFAFLEALLAARRCFLVSYTGRGLRDDAPKPPSVVVDELSDYLGRRFPGAVFEVRHPLQPFSPRYFSEAGAEEVGETAGDIMGEVDGTVTGVAPGPGTRTPRPNRAVTGRLAGAGALFSYSRNMCEAARTMLTGRAARPEAARLEAPLLGPGESPRHVTLPQLVDFFANPTRSFLRDRLGLRLSIDDMALDEEEPFELGALDRYRLRSEIRSRMQTEATPQRTGAMLRGSGWLPQSSPGRVEYERRRQEMQGLAQKLAGYGDALEATPEALDFELGGFRVTGALDHVGSEGMVWWRIGRLRARDRIEIRLRQLAWTASGRDPVPAIAVSFEQSSGGSAKGRTWRSRTFPVPGGADAGEESLEDWLRAWRHGRSAVLPFFPETSLAYAKVIAREGADAVEEAREKARETWSGSSYHRLGERDDAHFALVYDDRDPVTESFEAWAVTLLASLARMQG